MKGLAWLIVLSGAWLAIAPFVFHYKGTAQANDIVLGLTVGILGLIMALGKDQS